MILVLVFLGISQPAMANPPKQETAASESSSPFVHTPGFIVSIHTMGGLNVEEDDVDFGYFHPMLGGEIGYRFRTGTEPFASSSIGAGGHEGWFHSIGIGVRQRLQLGPVEPFVELAWSSVTAAQDHNGSLTFGAGVDLNISTALAVGISGGYFASEEVPYGALDWYTKAQLSYRFSL